VVAVDVCNVSSDGHLLAPMVQQTVKNAQATPDEVVADAGYDTHEGACACAELGIDAIVAPQTPLTAFWSVTDEGQIVRPMGAQARPSGNPHPKGNGKLYQTLRVAGCKTCPLFAECCGTSNGRTLSYLVGSDPVQRLYTACRARSPEGKAAMRDRMAKVEPVFADVKWNKGLNRFRLTHLSGARIEWTLTHMARNLAKLGKALNGHFSGFITARWVLSHHSSASYPRLTNDLLRPLTLGLHQTL